MYVISKGPVEYLLKIENWIVNFFYVYQVATCTDVDWSLPCRIWRRPGQLRVHAFLLVLRKFACNVPGVLLLFWSCLDEGLRAVYRKDRDQQRVPLLPVHPLCRNRRDHEEDDLLKSEVAPSLPRNLRPIAFSIPATVQQYKPNSQYYPTYFYFASA